MVALIVLNARMVAHMVVALVSSAHMVVALVSKAHVVVALVSNVHKVVAVVSSAHKAVALVSLLTRWWPWSPSPRVTLTPQLVLEFPGRGATLHSSPPLLPSPPPRPSPRLFQWPSAARPVLILTQHPFIFKNL